MSRLCLLLLLLAVPAASAAAQNVRDSVRMAVQMYTYDHGSSCGAGIYATWPNVMQDLLGDENKTYGYHDYGKVATEGMSIPGGYGQTYSKPEIGISVPDGSLGHDPQLGGGSFHLGDGDVDCSETVAAVSATLGGGESLLNGKPFRITEWYATYRIAAGTPVASFTWEQTEGLDVTFDGGFPNSREVELNGKVPVAQYSWDMGDGTSYSAAAPVHTYEEPGTYTVTLTVTDDDGETAEREEQVTVSSVVLEYSVIAPTLVKVGDTLGVNVRIKNVGTGTAATVSAAQSFARVPTYADSPNLVRRNAESDALESIADTTITDLAPGEDFWIYQFYRVTKSAEERIDGTYTAIPVDWRMTAMHVRGTDEDGNPVVARDICLDGSCTDVTRIPVSQLNVAMFVSRFDGPATTIKSGLAKYTDDFYPNGVFYHLVPPASLDGECNSGCVDLEIHVTNEDGGPVEGAVVELSRVLLDSDAKGGSVVTPDQGGGLFCFELECDKTLKLPATGADGRAEARFWVPGVVNPVDAYMKATATRESFTSGEHEEMVTILPNRVDVGQASVANPTNGDMTAISILAALHKTAKLPDLQKWCEKAMTWATDKDLELVALDKNFGIEMALKKGIEWTCGESLKKYIFDEEFALDEEIEERKSKLEFIDKIATVVDLISLHWFDLQFHLPTAGLGETSLTLEPPFLEHSSEFMDAVIEANNEVAWQYFVTGSVPTVTFDLYEVSHLAEEGGFENALYFTIRTTPDLDPKVDYKKLVTSNYNKSIFLTQKPKEAELAGPASASDQTIALAGPGKRVAADDSTFHPGHIVTIDPGTEFEESAQIVSLSGTSAALSVPLRYNHPTGARVAYRDSIGVASPLAPVNGGGASGLPGVSTTPVIKWTPLTPAMKYTLQVATDSLFENIVQEFADVAEDSVTLEELDDRTRYFWRIQATNLLGTGDWSTWKTFVTGRPWGDDLAEARTITDTPGAVHFAWHVAATEEAAEITGSCSAGSNSMWYSFTPSASRRVAFETFESGFNTAVSVWTGTAHPLTAVTCNDDYENGDHPTIEASYVEFDAEVGTTYFVRVTGVEGEGGPLFLTMRSPKGVGVEEAVPDTPQSLALSPAYPNPFNASTTLDLDVARQGHIRVDVFDVLGRRVATLQDGTISAGRHQLAFDGSGLPGGVYFVRLLADAGKQVVRTVTLLE